MYEIPGKVCRIRKIYFHRKYFKWRQEMVMILALSTSITEKNVSVFTVTYDNLT